jgi:dihydroflavonol-4-reductase
MSYSGVTLVTGATGLVGNNVVRLLLARGEPVRVLIRAAADRRPLDDLPLDVASGDVRDQAAVVRACQGVAAAIHCAGYVRIGWAQPDVYRQINAVGTVHVADACRGAGARMVHVSTTDVFGRCSLAEPTSEDTQPAEGPPVPYVTSKREAERAVRERVAEGLNAVTVNPGFMLGPWDWKPSSGKLLLAASRGATVFAPRGWFSLCDARDVAAGVVAARDRGTTGQRYILAGRTMQWIDGLRLFAEVGGWRRPLCRAGPLALKVAGWAGDCLGRVTGREPDVNSAAVALAGLPKNYTSARAQAELGYQMRPPAETVRDAWAWFREHGYS